MDEQIALTVETLRLNPALRRSGNRERTTAGGEVFVVKNLPARKYLTVTAEQWALLQNFVAPSTVPMVLRTAFRNRTCLPLREFYELVLKARRAGVLEAGGHDDRMGPRATAWPVAISPWLPVILACASFAPAIILLTLLPLGQPGTWQDFAIGWGMLMAALSIGYFLAASVLRGGGGEIYGCGFHLLHPIPHFKTELWDACMTSRFTEAGVICSRMFPVMAAAGLLSWSRPEWSLPLQLALLVMLRPFFGGNIPRLLFLILRGRVPDSHKDFLFSLNRRWRARVKLSLSKMSPGYIAARLAWGAAWIVLLVTVALRALGEEALSLFGSLGYWSQVGLGFSAITGVVLAGVLAGPVLRHLWRKTVSLKNRISAEWRRWRVDEDETRWPERLSRLMLDSQCFRRLSPPERANVARSTRTAVFRPYMKLHRFEDEPADMGILLPGPGAVFSRLLADSLLFRRLPSRERTDLIRRAQGRVVMSWSELHRKAEGPQEVGIIISGRVALYRRLVSGRPQRVLNLAEGDVFGAHALLDPQRGSARVRTRTPVVAAMLPADVFEKLVIGPLGQKLANELLQVVPFLKGIPLCANWHPQAVARFAQIAALVTYNEGDVIAAEGKDSQRFHVIYEGRVQVRRGRKNTHCLDAGAFFGEVSILQSSLGVADFIAMEPTRCLSLGKDDFLRFMTHNPQVGLQIERIGSRTLGRPIFPLEGGSFDVH
jgi:CRP-like cAMP-binding protein